MVSQEQSWKFHAGDAERAYDKKLPALPRMERIPSPFIVVKPKYFNKIEYLIEFILVSFSLCLFSVKANFTKETKTNFQQNTQNLKRQKKSQ